MRQEEETVRRRGGKRGVVSSSLHGGFTLIEVLLGVLMLAIVVSAILGVYMGQLTLSEHARNLSFAINDANRVLEELRNSNAGCSPAPNATSTGFTSWNAWLTNLPTDVPAGGGPKSLRPTAITQELIVVTCVQGGGVARPSTLGDAGDPPAAGEGEYCGDVDQIGSGEWTSNTGNTDFTSLDVYASVCWRHRGRVIGECAWDGATLTPDDSVLGGPGVGAGFLESPAMLSTVITCY